MVRAEELRTFVAVQRPIDDQAIEAEGDIDRQWQTVRTDWASFQHLGGQEFFDAQQLQVKVSHRVRMRYSSNQDLTSDHRLVRLSDDKVFQIAFVSGSPEGSDLMLMVVEGR